MIKVKYEKLWLHLFWGRGSTSSRLLLVAQLHVTWWIDLGEGSLLWGDDDGLFPCIFPSRAAFVWTFSQRATVTRKTERFINT